MIPNNKFVASVDNHLGGERVAMVIGKDATVHLMGLLTDLYSNSVLACIREYSTNAFDSHVDAANTAPIEVTTPNGYSPYFVVKDHGVGMDADTIRTLYSQYGESTKRDQKTTNGSMGIGAKAALGYTTQFTVTGIKNGVKTLVSVSRDEDGAGVMEIVATSQTSEPNGVEIKIPCKSGDEWKFASEAHDFFAYWKAGTVLLNGTDPHKDFEALTPRIQFIESSYDYVVMGNVAYRVDDEHNITKGDGRHVVAFVTMNGDDEVVFTPSREGLIYNALTKQSLNGLREEYRNAISDYNKNKVESAGTFTDAIATMSSISYRYGWAKPEDFTWNGVPPKHFNITHPTKITDEGSPEFVPFMIFYHNSKNKQIENLPYLNTRSVLNSNTVVITGFPIVRTVNYKFKERIKEYLAKQGISLTGFPAVSIYITSEPTLHPIVAFKDKVFHKWSDILASTRDPAPRVVVKTAGRYEAYDPTTGQFVLRDVMSNEKIIYWSPAIHARRPSSYNIMDIQKCFSDKTLIRANANRHAKLEKDFPLAEKWSSVSKEYSLIRAKRAFDALPTDFFIRKAYYEMFFNYGPLNGRLGERASNGLIKCVDLIDDEEYARVIRLACGPKPADAGEASNDPRWASSLVNLDKNSFENYLEKYPLSNGQWGSHPEACVEYVNMKYAKTKENSNGN